MELTFLIAVYFAPTIGAIMNEKKNNKAPAIIINIFLGWTFVGWVIALAMALSNDKLKA